MARYTDKFRASAVVILEAEGYPDREGALTKVSRHLKVPKSTLYRWYKRVVEIPGSIIETEKKTLVEYIDDELRGIFGDLPDARMDASYRDLGTVAGILMDKRQLLTGGATGRIEFSDTTRAKLDELRLNSDAVIDEFERLVAEEAAKRDNS